MEATGLFETSIPIYQSTLTLTTEEPDALIFRKKNMEAAGYAKT
jgi:hypothetical protein